MSIICRALDNTGDWTFGAGLNNYVSNLREVEQDIGMNLRMFQGDCFFAKDAGIDWFNLLGTRNQVGLNLAINAAILGTTGVTGLQQVFLSVSESRVLSVQYTVSTVYSTLTSQFSFDVGTL